MAFKPTKQQSLAITEKGNILVSAAAGSGKTAVLVERVISMLKDKNSPVSADELLIVTFTNAAANEMRSRIEKRLDEECRLCPNDTGLLLQKHLLSNAKICTIDSFCIDFVRENFDKFDISPDFKISDGNSLKSINEEVIYSIINRYLEEENPVFIELLDIIGAEFDEKNFADVVLQIYEFSRQMPFPEKWFNSLADNFENGIFSKENICYKYAFDTAKTTVKQMQDLIINAIDMVSSVEEAADKYLNLFSDAAMQISNLYDACNTNDWDTFYNALKDFSLTKLPTVKGLSGYSCVMTAKDIYKFLGDKALEGLNKIFYSDFEFLNSQAKKINRPILLLIEILKEFSEKLFLEYKNQNIFTFHNTEHLALSLLCQEKDGVISVNPDAKEFLDRFSEVMVDEYQDTNDLQDMLFYVLSNFEQKLFVVGDVKQSIYAFRGANPDNFLNKKNRYVSVDSARENDPKKIILGNNFRSKDSVCKFINYFFSLFMTDKTGDINYSADEELIPASVFPSCEDISVQFDIIDCAESNEKSIVLEARQIANFIKDTINGPPCIKQDDNTLRNARYGDFTIMLRSVANKAPELVSELKKQGIPINLSLNNFAESTEISTFLSLLKVIDNPQSDIELLTVLMSPIFSFTPDEMAQIRTEKKNGNLYSAVIFSAQKGNLHAKKFLETIEKFRLYSVTLSLPKLIFKLLIETEYLNIVCAMSDGEQRKNNLLLLCDYASQYSNSATSNLSGFIKYILKHTDQGKTNSSSGADTVKIMSIHASKGLQFPICILASTSSRFNDAEVRNSTVFSTKYGIGFKYFDEDEKTKFTTLPREVILSDIKKTAIQEELRLLYVAMTRAQDKLVFVSSFSNLDKSIEKYKNLLLSTNCEVDNSLLSRTNAYADWLILSLMMHPDGKTLREQGSGLFVKDNDSEVKINIIKGEDLLPIAKTSDKTTVMADNKIAEEIAENFKFQYPYNEIIGIQSKTSVSVLANKAEGDKYAFNSKPSFMCDGGMTAAERGTAMHKVMQFFDFHKCNDIESEIERLYEWQFITETEKDSLNLEALQAFFNSEIFKRIKNSSLVKREMRFLTEVKANLIDNTLDNKFDDETVIIQGAVDICFVEDGELVILDFKTDRVDDINVLADVYGEQLSIYAIACQKIFGYKVKEKVIYSFSKSDAISIK